MWHHRQMKTTTAGLICCEVLQMINKQLKQRFCEKRPLDPRKHPAGFTPVCNGCEINLHVLYVAFLIINLSLSNKVIPRCNYHKQMKPGLND